MARPPAELAADPTASVEDLRQEVACLRLLERIALASNEFRPRDVVMRDALVDICEFIGFPVGHVQWVVEGQGGPVTRPGAIWHLAAPGRFRAFVDATEQTGFDPGRGLPGRVVRSAKPAFIPRLVDDGNFGRLAAATASGLVSGLAFPVLAGADVVAVLELYGTEPYTPDEALLRVMAPAGALLGRAVERDRARRHHREMDERRQLILDSALDAFVSIDRDSRILQWNPAAERIFGWTEVEALGRQLAEVLIPERYRAAHHRGIERYLETGEGPMLGKRLELSALRKDGREIPVQLSITALATDAGQVFNAFLQDISERKREEHERERRERQLAEAHRIARLGSWEWDISSNRITWSDELYRIYGVDPQSFDPTYEAYLERIYPPDREHLNQIVQQAYGSGLPFETMHRFVRPDGTIGVMQSRGAVFRDTDGNPVRMAGTGQDVTEQFEAEERKRALLREQERTSALELSNQELEQFAYVASHDLQEPLRTISGYLQLIERRYADRLDDEAREFIGFATSGARRMQQLIEDLLAYSRVATKARPLEPVPLSDVVAEAQDNLALRLADSGARVECRVLPTVRGDRSQLVQVFQNLIANAVKFSGDDVPRVRIEAVRDEGMWQVAVRDEGLGFDNRYAERVFQVFQQVHGRQFEGTGIGLAICRKIVERHGGAIWAESTPGQGATFFFTLPSNGPEREVAKLGR